MNDILVSVVVVTYNSADYVIETLESIKQQSYSNIELIVTDDCSVDNTLTLVEEWVEVNKGRFKDTKIVRSKINTGITPNLNRGIRVASGQYIKPIAGDDLLCDSCIAKCLQYSLEHQVDFVYSKITPFNKSNPKHQKNFRIYQELSYGIFDLNVSEQYRVLLTRFSIPAPGLFFKKTFIINFGKFNETYSMMEDYPFVVKATYLGYKLNLVDESLVKYRVRAPKMRQKFFISNRNVMHTSDLARFQHDEILPRLKKEKMYLAIYNLCISILAARIEQYNGGLLCLYLSKIVGYLSIDKIKLKYKMLTHSCLRAKN